ncbi:MAG: hypothetical protein FWC78_03490 [Defluviitaleaceae bacterium]|nr:hypothetical protein [Defluviitaleaceae bacterium]
MPAKARETIKQKYPNVFWDTLQIFDNLGFSQVETVKTGAWSNENDMSNLADLCREMGTPLMFSTFTRYCVK